MLIETMRVYRKLCATVFAHINTPLLTIDLECPESVENGFEFSGEFDPEENRIRVWPKAHENIGEMFNTLVHELCHAEQLHRKQPLEHGARFSRRRRRMIDKYRKLHYNEALWYRAINDWRFKNV